MPTPYKPHIEIAHKAWKDVVAAADTVVDATCGNGHDTLYLANLLLGADQGKLYALDVQSEAISKAQLLLKQNVPADIFSKVTFVEGCHSKFPAEITPGTVKLVVYNLGYLPGGNKAFTTMFETTLLSIQHAMSLLQKGGLISITCYPGHAEGKREEAELLKWVADLNSKEWVCSHQRWINRQDAPSLLLLYKYV